MNLRISPRKDHHALELCVDGVWLCVFRSQDLGEVRDEFRARKPKHRAKVEARVEKIYWASQH